MVRDPALTPGRHCLPGCPRAAALPTLRQVLDGAPPANTPAICVDTLPGAQFRYSGGGTTIVQQLLGDVTGRPFSELARELVLEPFQRSGWGALRSPLRGRLPAHQGSGRPAIAERAIRARTASPSDTGAAAGSTERGSAAGAGDSGAESADVRTIGALSLTHASVDLNPSALAALLPLFYATFHLSYGATALLTALSQITNSACQLPFGYLADRVSLRWLAPVGCLLAGLGMALAGLAPTYPLLLLAICLMGLGVAMFHPEAARTANRVSGRQRATAMSYFSVGGNVGFAAGPVAASLLAGSLAHGGSLLFLAPTAATLALLRLLARPAAAQRAAPRSAPHPDSGAAAANGRAMTFLMVATVLRSAAQTAVLTFVPLYEVTVLHRSQAYASALMTAFLAAGALGTLAGGVIADRFGRQPAVLGSFALAAPLLFLFRHADGPLAFAALALAGGFLLSTFAVTIVMGQEYMPHRTGVAAGLTIGFASGVGGAAVGLLGHLADVAGVPAVLDLLVLLPILAAAAALGLGPRPRSRPLRAQER